MTELINIIPNKEIKIHSAHTIINWDGRIYKDRLQLLRGIKVGDIVRISIFVSNNSKSDKWEYTHDSPYVKIVSRLHTENVDKSADASATENDKFVPETFLGEVLHLNTKRPDKLPIIPGDRIWFNSTSIIEIPFDSPYFVQEERREYFKQFLSNDAVSITGPLFTVLSDYEISDDDNDNEDDDENDDENDNEDDDSDEDCESCEE
jgi:hypothetical protein